MSEAVELRADLATPVITISSFSRACPGAVVVPRFMCRSKRRLPIKVNLRKDQTQLEHFSPVRINFAARSTHSPGFIQITGASSSSLPISRGNARHRWHLPELRMQRGAPEAERKSEGLTRIIRRGRMVLFSHSALVDCNDEVAQRVTRREISHSDFRGKLVTQTSNLCGFGFLILKLLQNQKLTTEVCPIGSAGREAGVTCRDQNRGRRQDLFPQPQASRFARRQKQIALQSMLLVVEFAIASAPPHRATCASALDNSSRFDDQNLIARANCRETVRDDECRAAAASI